MICFILCCLFLCGCETAKNFFAPSPSLLGNVPVSEMNFKPSSYGVEKAEMSSDELLTFRCNDLPVGRVFTLLSDLSGRSIVWSDTIDDKKLSGYFQGVPLSKILDSFARRCQCQVVRIGEVYYVGIESPDDLSLACLPCPPGAPEEFKTALSGVLSSHGKLSIIGGQMFLRDSSESLSKVLAELERYRVNSSRRYVAELYFIRVSDAALLDLSARLQVEAVDLLTVHNLEQLFSLLLEVEGSSNASEILQRPTLTLSEGQVSSLHVGQEKSFVRRTVGENGVIVASGYDVFSDGLICSLICRRVSKNKLSLSVDLEVSEFTLQDSTAPPAKSTDKIELSALLDDGKPYLLGSLSREGFSSGYNLFGRSKSSNTQTLMVWARVRELSSFSMEKELPQPVEAEPEPEPSMEAEPELTTDF